jgi:O-antigen/teichoic acid export membrane protein
MLDNITDRIGRFLDTFLPQADAGVYAQGRRIMTLSHFVVTILPAVVNPR